jgi:GT2 family glycosyltransferase
MDKILVGCVTYDGHSAHLEKFSEAFKNLGKDIIFADNSFSEDYSKLLKSKGFNVLRKSPEGKNRIQRIIEGRNLIREYFLNNNYSHLFFLDTDIVLHDEIIQNLLQCESDVASGVYLCNQEIEGKMYILPTIYKPGRNDDFAEIVKIKDIIPEKIFDIAICGLGCCLIKRKVLEKISFRQINDSDEGGEDVAFCLDARKAGFSLKVNTAVKCEHIVKLNGKIGALGIKKPDLPI